MTNCKHCRTPITEKYCANCGHAAKLHRIDRHYIAHEIEHLLHFEKGVFYTVKELIVRPGHSIREFIEENRNKHMKPVAFLILTSIIYSLIAHIFYPEEMYNVEENALLEKSNIATIRHWVGTHYGYANIIMSLFIVLTVKLFFKNYKYNLYEITILLCFVMGQGMLLLSVEAFFAGLVSKQLFLAILVIISFAYPTWAIGQFYDPNKVKSYVKAFLAYLIGYLLFDLAATLVGVVADLAVKFL